jgi:hypothetical protein
VCVQMSKCVCRKGVAYKNVENKGEEEAEKKRELEVETECECIQMHMIILLSSALILPL